MSALHQHPLSAAWPKMRPADFDALVADIRAHGQVDPGVLFDGQVLDGWHRYKACELVGIEYRAVEFDGIDPRSFVISKNGRRRHESAAVLAVSAAACMEWRPNGGDQSAPGRSGTTIKEAAVAVGVGERTMERAKAAVQVGLGDEVKEGHISLKQAEQISQLPKAKRQKAVQAIKDGEPPKPKARSSDAEKLEARMKEMANELADLRESLAEMTALAESAKAFEEKDEFKEMQVLRLELKSCKRRRDELMAENAALKKDVIRWRKKVIGK